MQTCQGNARTQRNASIDVFRGVLLLGVMLGHLAEITQPDSFAMWIGIGFRMPVFIGLSGYLFQLECARAMPLSVLSAKYYRRLILPWLVACAVYLTLSGRIGWLTPIDVLVRPPIHLWFVPVLVVFMVCASMSRLQPLTMLAIALPLSIAAMYLFGVGRSVEQYAAWMPDRRYFTYPIYFFLGLWVARSVPDPGKLRVSILSAVIGLLWWSRLYYQPSNAAEVAAELILCVPVIGLLPWVRGLSLDLPPLSGIGRDSLFFYLWHPLAFALCAVCGMTGVSMLTISLLFLAMARWMIARMPHVCDVLGVQPKMRVSADESRQFAESVSPRHVH